SQDQTLSLTSPPGTKKYPGAHERVRRSCSRMTSSHVSSPIRLVAPAHPQKDKPKRQDQERPTNRDPRNTDAPKRSIPSEQRRRPRIPSLKPTMSNSQANKPTPAIPPGKNHHQEPNPSGRSGSHSILAMMPQVSNALQASLLGASDPQPRGTNPSAPQREDT